MSNSIYPKLALTNLKKNRKNYVPYILTCIITIAMYYIMYAISYNPGIDEVMGAEVLRTMMSLGTNVVGIFACIFLFYTNSFLMKQRKKEIGLYNVLGLGKRHIAKMMLFEMLVVVLISLTVGLLSGILLSKLMFLLLLKLLHFTVILEFTIEMKAIVGTFMLFSAIFLVNLCFNLLQIKIANPIELLHGGNQGEKEPKSKRLLAVFGLLTLGGGYYIAQTTESPLDALGMFFIAVILVIAGTYALFTAGSIVLLKGLKKNKKFYYHTKHFISVSGMMYRMKQNAVGLANICILSTMVLVIVSTSVAMYVGMDDLLRTRYAYECIVTAHNVSEADKAYIHETADRIIEKHGLTKEQDITYEYTPFICEREGGKFRFLTEQSSETMTFGNAAGVYMMTVEEYNRLENKNISLGEEEAIIFSTKTKLNVPEIQLDGKTYRVKKYLKDMKVEKETQMIVDSYYMIVSDSQIISNLQEKYGMETGKIFHIGIDFEQGREKQIPVLEEIETTLSQSEISLSVEGRELQRESFYSLYGTFLFLGIFLGLLFLMATVLIIYYKQISEGYDDKERFAIMQKVGLSKWEVKQSIRSQVMIVFFLPLLVAICHITLAFKVITKLLAMLNLTNVPLFLVCTVISVVVFVIFYACVFAVTAREYYKIVK